jgi:lipooligosaccharide transport system permease protein
MSEAASPARVRRPPGRAARLASVWFRHWKVYSDTFFANATPAVFEPLFLLLAVGVGVGRYLEVRFNDLGYDEFMAPGVLGMTALYTAAFEATYATFVRMRYQHTYQTMLATPLTLRDVFTGEILWCASKGVLYTSIVAAVLAAVGATSAPWIVLAPVAGFLTSLAFAGLSFLVTSVVRNMNHFQFFFTAGLTPMVFFSGLMFPVQDLPGVLPELAYATPMFHAIETFRLLTSGPEHASVPWAAWCPVVLTAYALVFAVLGVRAMERRLRA